MSRLRRYRLPRGHAVCTLSRGAPRALRAGDARRRSRRCRCPRRFVHRARRRCRRSDLHPAARDGYGDQRARRRWPSAGRSDRGDAHRRALGVAGLETDAPRDRRRLHRLAERAVVPTASPTRASPPARRRRRRTGSVRRRVSRARSHARRQHEALAHVDRRARRALARLDTTIADFSALGGALRVQSEIYVRRRRGGSKAVRSSARSRSACTSKRRTATSRPSSAPTASRRASRSGYRSSSPAAEIRRGLRRRAAPRTARPSRARRRARRRPSRRGRRTRRRRDRRRRSARRSTDPGTRTSVTRASLPRAIRACLHRRPRASTPPRRPHAGLPLARSFVHTNRCRRVTARR